LKFLIGLKAVCKPKELDKNQRLSCLPFYLHNFTRIYEEYRIFVLPYLLDRIVHHRIQESEELKFYIKNQDVIMRLINNFFTEKRTIPKNYFTP